MSNENETEIKCVFGLLDPNQTREIHVNQISDLVHSLEKLSPTKQRSKTTEKTEETNIAKVKLKPAREVDKRNSMFMITTQKGSTQQKRNSLKKNMNESISNNEILEKASNNKINVEETTREAEEVEKEKFDFSLNIFPNKKKTMDYEEFSDLYLDTFGHGQIDEEILLRCFSLFDQEKQGYLNAAAVKKVFQVFNEKVTEEEIESKEFFKDLT